MLVSSNRRLFLLRRLNHVLNNRLWPEDVGRARVHHRVRVVHNKALGVGSCYLGVIQCILMNRVSHFLHMLILVGSGGCDLCQGIDLTVLVVLGVEILFE